MARHYNLKFVWFTSLLFIVAFSAVSLAQNTARNRSRTTSHRKVSPTAIGSLESPATFSPVLITYSRDGAEVDDRKSANVAKQNVGVGESITIYYGSSKSSASKLPKLTPKPKTETVASNAAKAIPPKPPSSNPEADKPAGISNQPVNTGSALPTSTATTSISPTEIPPAAPIEKPIDAGGADPNASGSSDPKQTAANETAVKTDTPPINSTDSKPVPPPPVINPAGESKSEPAIVTAPISNASTDPKSAANAATPAEKKPEPEVSSPAPSDGAEAVALNNAAVQLIGESRYAEAADALRRAIQAKPGSYKLHRNLSIVYERMNKMNEALESAEAAVAIAPAEPSALMQVCSLQVQLTKFDEARICYENVSKLTTLDAISMTSYGVALLGTGRNREAVALLQKNVSMNPPNGETLNALGVAYFDGKRFADAISTFNKAVELDPTQHALRFNLAIAYLANGSKEAALGQYKLLKQEDANLAAQLYLILFRDKVVSVDELKHR